MKMLNQNTKYQKGFTLLELLIVIGIIAVVSSVSILVINPGEYFKRGRDVQRIADLNNLHLALTLYYTSGVSNFDLDGPKYSDSCSDQASPKVFISTPSGVAGPANLPSNWSYASSTSANLRKTDGNGWIPVNLASIPAGSPLNNLPIDPTNDVNYALHYTYACQSSPGHYELNANLESRQFNKGGKDDRTSKDGGDDPNVYEVGSRLTISPLAPVGYWALDEGSGAVAGDSSKNGNNGTLVSSPTWQTETACKVGKCLSFNGSSDYVDMGTNSVFSMSLANGVTWTAWIKTNTGVHRTVMKHGAYGAYSPRLAVQSSLIDYYYTNGVNSSSVTMNDNNWHFVTYIASGSAVYFYVDGIARGSGGISFTGNTVNIFRVGQKACDGCSDTYFIGNIDEVAVFNRALSAAEISAIYNATR